MLPFFVHFVFFCFLLFKNRRWKKNVRKNSFVGTTSRNSVGVRRVSPCFHRFHRFRRSHPYNQLAFNSILNLNCHSKAQRSCELQCPIPTATKNEISNSFFQLFKFKQIIFSIKSLRMSYRFSSSLK